MALLAAHSVCGMHAQHAAAHRCTHASRPRHRVMQPPRSSLSARCRPLVPGPLFGVQHAASRARCLRTWATIQEAPLTPVYTAGELTQFPDGPGVYAVYDANGTCLYIGVSRKISLSVAGHLQDQAQFTHAVKYTAVEDGSREALTVEWQAWLEQAVAETNAVPPGNEPGNTVWQRRAKPPKPEVLLTAGKPVNTTIEALLDQVVKTCKVVAFIKGKRRQPMCGFSNKMLNMLNDAKVDYEVVDVLDELHNPGLREVIKTYSQWPTIPQLYVNGEFVGGADIVEQLQKSGELEQVLAAAKS